MSEPRQRPITPPQAQLKLRSSCDACGQAKIKCDRSQPACARCMSQGMSCIYGVSRKAGKPPRKRPAHSSSLPSRLDLFRSSTRSIDLPSSGNEPISESIDMMLHLTDGGMPIDSPFAPSDVAFQPWFPFDSMDSFGALTPPFSSDRDSPMSRQSENDYTESAQRTTERPPTATATSKPPSLRRYCTQEAKDIMRRLYCANPASSAQDGVPARTLELESVLTRNRDVVAHLGALLKCPCARSPHTAMLYASIVSRVLLWYQQAAVNASAAGPSPLPPSSPTQIVRETRPSLSSSSSSEPLDMTASDDYRGISVLPTPFIVGTFQSNDLKLQTAMTNCLLLSELRNVGNLIQAFVLLGTSASYFQNVVDGCPAAGESSSGRVDASLFASLGAWLRTEHGRIVRKAKSGLYALDEDLRL